jgi:hypothetical protein
MTLWYVGMSCQMTLRNYEGNKILIILQICIFNFNTHTHIHNAKKAYKK